MYDMLNNVCIIREEKQTNGQKNVLAPFLAIYGHGVGVDLYE